MAIDEEVREAAARLGLGLSDDELELFAAAVASELGRQEAFLAAPLEESRPAVVYPDRDPGRRPTAEENRHNAWLWRCAIAGASEGVLAGKTVGFKDHVPVAGIPLTYGCRELEGLVPDFDATIVTRVLEAGGTVIGKNALNGFTGIGGPSGEGDYPRPLNPHAPGRITGGSSSGSAAAVAAGEVDVSFAGDQGGSVRIPASWCGVVGLKPTFGLVSHFGLTFGYDQSLDHVGPLARRVEDAARALDAVAGYDPLDPRQRRDHPDSVDALGALDDGVAGLRVGMLDEGFEGADDGVARAVADAVEALSADGAMVERISVPEHDAVRAAARALIPEGAHALAQTTTFGAFGLTYYPPELVAALARLWRDDADRLNPRTKLAQLTAELARQRWGGRVYAKAHNVRAAFTSAYDAALARVDVLAMPTAPFTAPRFEPRDAGDALRQTLAAVDDNVARNTQPFNYTGHPAVSVPCGRSNGLPLGLQLVARRFDDALVLRVAQAVERSCGGPLIPPPAA